jgi:hypothetical protein
MRVLWRPLDWALIALLLVSITVILLTNEDPFFRNALCTRVPCPRISPAWHHIGYELAVGSVISLFFYWLVVRLPEYQRRQRIKRSFRTHYRRFKEDCISTILGVADGGYDVDLVDTLLAQPNFREYFKQKVSASEERWHRFLNNLDEANLRELKTSLEIFRVEVEFVLNTTNIPDDEAFEFLKRLSAATRSMQDTTLGYDETKVFSRFLWEVFAGFNIVSGYSEMDIIEKMIDSV